MFGLRGSGNSEVQAKLAALDRSQAVIEFTVDGTILTANDNFLNTLGYALDEIKGKHHRIFVEPGYASSTEYRQFWEKLGRGEFQSSQFQRFRKDGRAVWIEASYNPLIDKNGKVTKIVKFASDITSRIAADADRKGQIEAIRKSFAVIEFDMAGNILDERWLRKSGQRDEWIVCLMTAMMAVDRRDDEQATTQEPQPCLQGEDCPRCGSRREDAGRAGAAV